MLLHVTPPHDVMMVPTPLIDSLRTSTACHLPEQSTSAHGMREDPSRTFEGCGGITLKPCECEAVNDGKCVTPLFPFVQLLLCPLRMSSLSSLQFLHVWHGGHVVAGCHRLSVCAEFSHLSGVCEHILLFTTTPNNP